MAEVSSGLHHYIKSGKTLRVGLISNPLSGGNRKGLQAIRELVRKHPQVCHLEASIPSDVERALAEFARRAVDIVAVNGGDGTVHAVLTEFFRRPWSRQIPLFALMRAGTASMIARDVGLPGSRRGALSRFLKWLNGTGSRATVVQRPVLKVDGTSDQQPLYGMFFGAAGICQGIRFCLNRVHTTGVKGQTAAGVTLVRLLLAATRRDRRILFPISASVALDGVPQEEGEFLVILISTLERLFLGIRPYWGSGLGGLYYTALGVQPRHFLKTVPFLLRSRKSRFATPEHGYHSRKVRKARLTFSGEFTLDGELYALNNDAETITVTEGGKASFLRLQP